MVVLVYFLLFCAIVFCKPFIAKVLPAFKKKIPANVDFTPEQNKLLTPERGPFKKKDGWIIIRLMQKNQTCAATGKNLSR